MPNAPIGTAEVEVRGDITQLREDLAKARQETMNFNRAAEQQMGGARRAFAATNAEVQRTAEGFGTNLRRGVASGAQSFQDLQRQYLSTIDSSKKARSEIDRITASLERMRAGGPVKASTVVDLQDTIGQLEEIEAELMSVEQAQDDAGDSAEEMGEKTSRATGAASRSVLDLGQNVIRATAVMAAFATAAFIGAERSLDSVAAIGRLSDEVDSSTDFIQEFRFAIEQSGGSAEEADGILRSLTERLREAAREGGDSARIFEALGVAVKDSEGNARSAEAVYRELAQAISEIEDPARQAAVAQDIFGDSSGVLIGLLQQGADGFSDLADEARNLGIILDRDLIDNAERAHQELAVVKRVVSAEMARAIADNADSVVDLANAFGELIGPIARATGAVANFLRYVGRVGAVSGRMAQDFGVPGGDTIFGRAAIMLNPSTSMMAHDLTQRMNARERQRQRGGAFGGMVQGTFDRVAGAMAAGEATTPDYGAIDGALAGGSSSGGGGGGRTRRSRNRRTVRDESLRTLEQHLSELDRLADRQITAESAITIDAERLAELQRRRIERRFDADMRDAENNERETRQRLDDFIARDDISAAQRERAIAERDLLGARREEYETALENIRNDELALIDMRERERVREQELEVLQTSLASQTDILDAQIALADTARERRDLELRIFDLQEREERARLQGIILSEQSNDHQKAIAQAQLDALDELRSFRIAAIERANQSPGGKFLDEITMNAEEAREAIESVTVDALGNLGDNILQVITLTKGLGEAFRDVAQSIISDLLRIAIQAQIVQPLAQMFFGGGGKTGGPLGFLGDIFGSSGGSPLGALVGHRGIGIGTGNTIRSVPAETFINAPRLHNGLMPGEFPAILERGETVIPKDRSMGQSISFGDIIVPGARDEREARRTGKQAAAEIHSRIAEANKTGAT